MARRRARPEQHERRRRGFFVHLAAFVVVVGALGVLNLTRNPSHPWFLLVLVAWGIGLAAHAFAVFGPGFHHPLFEQRETRGFVIHAGVFVAVSLLLIVLNLLLTPDHWWFRWILLGWGLGLAAHGLAVFRKERREEVTPASARARRRRDHRPAKD